jgi:hypothetical protein
MYSSAGGIPEPDVLAKAYNAAVIEKEKAVS